MIFKEYCCICYMLYKYYFFFSVYFVDSVCKKGYGNILDLRCYFFFSFCLRLNWIGIVL